MPNFDISVDDLATISTESFSVDNRFKTQLWVKGGREIAGDEARELLNEVCLKPSFQ
jgi:hypothetical protein